MSRATSTTRTVFRLNTNHSHTYEGSWSNGQIPIYSLN